MSVPHPSVSAAYPPHAEVLEEVCAAGTRDMAGALVFALSRLAPQDGRGVALATSRAWLGEHGRPYGPGLVPWGLEARRGAVILISGRTEADMLWAMEQGLRSGALAAVLGAVEGASLAQTRRLEFAARDGNAVGVLLRATGGGLSAARRRWRISTSASFTDRADPRAPGGSVLTAELTRSRAERPGAWMLEQDDETHRLRLADRLAGDGLGAIGRADFAA